MTHTNPFTFGALALDRAFTNREAEIRELVSDMQNGQDVLVYAPRRYGKSSLVLRAGQRAIRKEILVGYCDLMRTPTKERFAAALARTIYSDLETAAGQAIERASRLFRGLRVTPTMEVDPIDGSLRFVFHAGRQRAAIDDTIEALLALPGQIAAERKRRAVLVFDEFQEIVTLDRHFPNLMRSVFQEQPEVGHVYLGSKRHVLERIFEDENEPFWRSAKRLEVGAIAPAAFARFLRQRFEETDKGVDDNALSRLLEATGGHPYGTQELAYFLWELVPTGHFARLGDVEAALGQVLRSEHNHFAKLWDDAPHAQRLVMLALAEEPTRSPYSADYAERRDLPPKPALQRAIGALVSKEIVARDAGKAYWIVEPFFADWLRSEQEAYGLADDSAAADAPSLLYAARSSTLLYMVEAGGRQDALLAQMRRGTLQYCVLALLVSDERYGFDLVRGLAQVDGMVTSEGTIYPLLSRLRRDGLVESSWRESSSGPPRRYYRLTRPGATALDDFRREWSRFRDAVDTFVGGKDGDGAYGRSSR